jgi:hypothetical protein
MDGKLFVRHVQSANTITDWVHEGNQSVLIKLGWQIISCLTCSTLSVFATEEAVAD